MYQFVNMEKLACLRRRLAIEADTAITSTLTHLWEKETERSAIAIQKEIDRRDGSDLGDGFHRRRNDLSAWGRTEACPDMTSARGSAASLSRVLPTRIVPKL
jgi:hypothetical protein